MKSPSRTRVVARAALLISWPWQGQDENAVWRLGWGARLPLSTGVTGTPDTKGPIPIAVIPREGLECTGGKSSRRHGRLLTFQSDPALPVEAAYVLHPALTYPEHGCRVNRNVHCKQFCDRQWLRVAGRLLASELQMYEPPSEPE